MSGLLLLTSNLNVIDDRLLKIIKLLKNEIAWPLFKIFSFMQELLIETSKPFYWKPKNDSFDLNNEPLNYIRCINKENKIQCIFYGTDVAKAEKESLHSGDDLVFVEISSFINIEGERYPCLEYKCLNKPRYSDDKTIDNEFSVESASWGRLRGQNFLGLTFSCYRVFGQDFFRLGLRHTSGGPKTDEYKINNYEQIEEWRNKLHIEYYHPVQQILFFVNVFKKHNPLIKSGYPIVKELIACIDSKRKDYCCLPFNTEVVSLFIKRLNDF